MADRGGAADDAGIASAAVNTMQQIGGSVGTALLDTLAASAAAGCLHGRDATSEAVRAQATLESYATAYWWSAGIYAAGALLALYRRGVPRGDGAVVVHM